MPCAFKTSEEDGFIPGCVASRTRELNVLWATTTSWSLFSVRHCPMKQSMTDWLYLWMVLVLQATIPDQLLLLSCRKMIAAIESHRLHDVYQQRDFIPNFLELTRVYNFSIMQVWCYSTPGVVYKYVKITHTEETRRFLWNAKLRINTFVLSRFLNGRLPGGSYRMRGRPMRYVFADIVWANGSVPYRPQTISATTISATNHIGHDHIGHTKRPYRPKGITISATKM